MSTSHVPLDPSAPEADGRFPCPHCDVLLVAGTPACPSCGLRLVGTDAARLWQVNQQIAALRGEADRLIARLLQPAPESVEVGPDAGLAPGGGGTLPPYPAGPTGPAERRPLSGQQLLLGLGALLLLSGASFFLLVVWLVVGVAGQALIMAALTGAAVVAAGAATRRRLPAAAQTAGVIATGLLVLDLWAAHRLGLAGLDRLAGDVYWTVAGVLGGALLLGFERAVPRRVDDVPVRRVWIYRPAASFLLTLAATCAVAALDPGVLALCGLALLLAVACLLGVATARRFDLPDLVTPLPEPGSPARTMPWSALPPLLVAVGAGLLHLLCGVLVGYDPASTGVERYTAMGLLLLAPLGLALVALLPVASGGRRARSTVATVALVLAAPAAGVVVLDAHRALVVAASFVLAGLLAAAKVASKLATDRRRDAAAPRPSTPAWEVVGWVAQPLLLLLVLAVADAGVVDGLGLLGDHHQVPTSWWLPVLPALAWAGATLTAAVVTRSGAWAVLAQGAVLATLLVAVRDAQPLVQVVVMLVACAISLAVAGVARALPESDDARLLDASAVLLAGLYGAVAILASLSESPYLVAAAFVATGACTLAYAGSPGRLGFAYPGSLLVSAGTSVLLDRAGVEVVEAYTAPLVLLLAGIGWMHHRRDPSAPTVLTMGPALGVALLPSLYVGIEEGAALRLAAVTLAGILVLVVGLARRWRAPVTLGTVVLVLVALTQGGPLVAWIPGWVILIGAGALLLWIGVAWEKAVLAGRRTASWYATLR